MDILIITFIILSLLHFIYESIIAPSIRLKQRHELFILRDQINDIELENNLSNNDKRVIQILEQQINNTLDRMNAITLYNVYYVNKEYKNNDYLQKEFNKKKEIIKNIENKEIKEINIALSYISIKIFMTNIAAWLIYLVPVAIPLVLIIMLGNKIKNFLFKLIQELLLIPNKNLENIDFLYKKSFK